MSVTGTEKFINVLSTYLTEEKKTTKDRHYIDMTIVCILSLYFTDMRMKMMCEFFFCFVCFQFLVYSVVVVALCLYKIFMNLNSSALFIGHKYVSASQFSKSQNVRHE